MQNKIISLLVLMMTFVFSACSNNLPEGGDGNELTAPSASSIQAQHEALYAKKLIILRRKNATQEANGVIRSGAPYIMGYYAGRSNHLLTPGVSAAQKQSIKGKCQIKPTDGFGDVIYGGNHSQYRQALRNYMTAFNQKALVACLRK